MYRPNLDEDDMTEMEEERLRMREHVMNEVSWHEGWGMMGSLSHTHSQLFSGFCPTASSGNLLADIDFLLSVLR